MMYQTALELSRTGPFDCGCVIGVHIGPGGVPGVHIVLHERLQLPLMLYRMGPNDQWILGRTNFESLESIFNWMPVMPGSKAREQIEQAIAVAVE